ncbi:MAG: magnesium/cobalt transporter CorA [Rhizobiaceae bacterium]|nr:magnesium/cobalt transporter CorA [Rhizobiaceae bacterium]
MQPQDASPRSKRSPVGASPGTLIAHPLAKPTRLTLTLIEPNGFERIDGATLLDVRASRGRWPLIWIDCVGLADVALIADLGAEFGLHPLALEDTLNTVQRPKADFFDDHAFVVLSMIDEPATQRYEQISLYFGADFVITFQEREGDPFGPVHKRIAAPVSHRIRHRQGDYLAYALIDSIVDSYFPVLDTIGEAIDTLEDEMLKGPERGQVRRMHFHKRSIIGLKRVLWPLRDAVAGLARAEAPFVHNETRIFLNDTLDHCVRLIEIVETERDVLTGLIEMHISLSQARTNDVISFLTIVSAIFIPLTFLAGIWGMNFDPQTSPWNMPELLSFYGYPIALGSMLAIALGLVLFFRWRKWL